MDALYWQMTIIATLAAGIAGVVVDGLAKATKEIPWCQRNDRWHAWIIRIIGLIGGGWVGYLLSNSEALGLADPVLATAAGAVGGGSWMLFYGAIRSMAKRAGAAAAGAGEVVAKEEEKQQAEDAPADGEEGNP